MSDTATETAILTADDVEILNAARTVLAALEQRVSRQRHTEPRDWNEPDGYDYGRVAEACDRADSSIFRVLNVASSYRVVQLTEEQLHNRGETESDVNLGPPTMGDHEDEARREAAYGPREEA